VIKEHDLKIANTKYNDVTRAKHLENEICWSFWNHHRITQNLKSGNALDLTVVPKAEGKPILIIGSGPSFDKCAPYLKDWPGDIMTSTSQAATCIYYGKDPKYIVALDPESHQFELMADDFANRGCILITHPGVKPDLIDFWNGKTYYYRKVQPQTAYYSGVQRIGYSTIEKETRSELIRESVIMLACVGAAQVCIASILGYSRMYLIGLDFGCPGGQTRFTQYDYKYTKKKVFAPGNAPEIALGSPGEWVRNDPHPMTAMYNVVGENGCLTAPLHAFYKQQFITAWRILIGDFINVSSEGMLYELPQADIETVINDPDSIGGFDRDKIKDICDEYLAKHNTFVIEVSNGVSVLQYSDPLKEIPEVMERIVKLSRDQGKDITVDMDSNMDRIKRILDKIGYEPPKDVVTDVKELQKKL